MQPTPHVPPPAQPYTFHVIQPVAELDLWPGDLLVLTFGGPVPMQAVRETALGGGWMLVKPLPTNYGLLLVLLEQGAIRSTRDDDATVPAELRRVVGAEALVAPPLDAPARPRPRLLR